MADKITKTEEEWQEQLTPEQYHVTRQKGTEQPFTGEYDNCKTPGTFNCSCCNAPLFASDHKFDSGSGWPSYWQPASDGVVATKTDFKMIIPRTECHCATCGLHQGHVFKDGPPPTGERWCINGVVLDFRPAE